MKTKTIRQYIRAAGVALLSATAAAAEAQQPVTPAGGDTVVLTLVEAQRRSLTVNPAFLADAREGTIARGELRQARVQGLNPELELEAPRAASDAGVGEYEARLSQEVPWAGQRGLRIRAAELGVARADWGVRNAAREALAATTLAYFAALAAERRLGLATELEQLNDRLLSAARVQLQEGEISALEANLASIENGRARARVLAAQRQAASARLELQRLTGIAPDRTVHLSDPGITMPSSSALSGDSLLTVALERRPDLAASRSATEQADALARLARREGIPNLRLGAFVERTEIPGSAVTEGKPAYESPRLGLAVSVPVPLFDRNQGTAAQRSAQAEQAHLSRSAMELTVRTQVSDALRAYATAQEEAGVFERDVLEPARSNQQLLDTAFRAGKLNLTTLLLLRNQLLDAELGYWDAWLAARRAWVELQSAIAAFVPDPDLNLESIR